METEYTQRLMDGVFLLSLAFVIAAVKGICKLYGYLADVIL